MPPNHSGSEDHVDTQAPESEDQVLTDELREEILAATDEYKKVNHG